MAFNINDFLGNVQLHDEIAKTNHFEVFIVPPQRLMSATGYSKIFGGTGIDVTRWLAFQAESAELPGRVLNTITPKIYGVPYRTPATTDYQEISVTLLCTGTFWERKFFDAWIDYIQPRDTFNFKYRDDYTTSVFIYQYNQFADKEGNPNKAIYAVELEEAYPTIVAPQALNWAGDEQHKLSVTFSFIRWKTPYLPETILDAAGSSAITDSNSGVKQPVGSTETPTPTGQSQQDSQQTTA
jgi:hypothetical protein